MNTRSDHFFTRGLLAAWGGPVVLATVYLILGSTGAAEAVEPTKIAVEFFTVTLLAFLCGSMSAIYQNERLPLAVKITLHALVLYGAYAAFYLINGFLPDGAFLFFTAIFFVSFALTWAVVYLCIRRKTHRLNAVLKR